MCRILGVVAREATGFVDMLRDAPRSLATLSDEHPHGWGIGVSERTAQWHVTKSAVRAHDDPGFHDASRTSRGRILLAHIRKQTVGCLSIHNTHPFHRGRWLFAHNGTISDTRYLVRNASPERTREISGDTDSEKLFAYVLTHLDAAGAADHDASDATDQAVLGAVRGALAQPDFGACNFLLSDGHALYAHRWGRTLFVLERPAEAVLVASEAMTHERWHELPEAALLRLDGGARPAWRLLG